MAKGKWKRRCPGYRKVHAAPTFGTDPKRAAAARYDSSTRALDHLGLRRECYATLERDLVGIISEFI
jgi:hypothetical protein